MNVKYVCVYLEICIDMPACTYRNLNVHVKYIFILIMKSVFTSISISQYLEVFEKKTLQLATHQLIPHFHSSGGRLGRLGLTPSSLGRESAPRKNKSPRLRGRVHGFNGWQSCGSGSGDFFFLRIFLGGKQTSWVKNLSRLWFFTNPFQKYAQVKIASFPQVEAGMKIFETTTPKFVGLRILLLGCLCCRLFFCIFSFSRSKLLLLMVQKSQTTTEKMYKNLGLC